MIPRRSPGRLRGTAVQAVRVLRLYLILRDTTKRLNLDDLAQMLDVVPRTVRRDLDVLACAGVKTSIRKGFDDAVVVEAAAIADSAPKLRGRRVGADEKAGAP